MNERQAGVMARPRPFGPELHGLWRERKHRIAARSDRLVATFGHDPRALDYENWSAQQARFHVLAEALPLNGRRVLDVGCGFADFADYLMVNYGPVQYEGVDICAAAIEEAQRRHPSLSLNVLDILEEDPGGSYDFVVANGLFYSLDEDSRGDAPAGIMCALITRMFELSSSAVAFTTRSAWAGTRQLGEFHADPLETVAFCRTLTARVTLRHDYLPGDFAVFLFRDDSPNGHSRAEEIPIV